MVIPGVNQLGSGYHTQKFPCLTKDLKESIRRFWAREWHNEIHVLRGLVWPLQDGFEDKSYRIHGNVLVIIQCELSKSLSLHDGNAKKDTYIRDVVKEKKSMNLVNETFAQRKGSNRDCQWDWHDLKVEAGQKKIRYWRKLVFLRGVQF